MKITGSMLTQDGDEAIFRQHWPSDKVELTQEVLAELMELSIDIDPILKLVLPEIKREELLAESNNEIRQVKNPLWEKYYERVAPLQAEIERILEETKLEMVKEIGPILNKLRQKHSNEIWVAIEPYLKIIGA
jgi:hypothetical protein